MLDTQTTKDVKGLYVTRLMSMQKRPHVTFNCVNKQHPHFTLRYLIKSYL